MKAFLKWLWSFRRPPRWEAVLSSDGEATKVRWSRPDWRGRYLCVGHYGASRGQQHMAVMNAKHFNDEGRRPEE